jgi:hypothetical protein
MHHSLPIWTEKAIPDTQYSSTNKSSGATLAKSKKQRLVSASSTEAEIVAMYDATIQSLWLKNMLLEIGIKTPKIKIFEDNESAIRIAAHSPILKGYSKFIDIKYKILNLHYENNEIEFQYIPSSNQIADVLTKPITDKNTLKRLKDKLLGISHQKY